ncbi:hypothetical protein CLF_106740 [Clonorchis sinensis]|uniref:Uncharacterized protein n=1 Tax=Clonorchis sinensis TaxID=79923 RepID=G7YFM2_CLOSI|nr:hypothetical protein CLF_106740 [Clonorchis sinensis]
MQQRLLKSAAILKTQKKRSFIQYSHLRTYLLLTGDNSIQLNLRLRLSSTEYAAQAASRFSWYDIRDIAIHGLDVIHYSLLKIHRQLTTGFALIRAHQDIDCLAFEGNPRTITVIMVVLVSTKLNACESNQRTVATEKSPEVRGTLVPAATASIAGKRECGTYNEPWRRSSVPIPDYKRRLLSSVSSWTEQRYGGHGAFGRSSSIKQQHNLGECFDKCTNIKSSDRLPMSVTCGVKKAYHWLRVSGTDDIQDTDKIDASVPNRLGHVV